MTVGKAIYYLLTNSTDIAAIVSTRVFPEVAQQDALLPYVVYNVTNNEPSDTKAEPSELDTANVEVNCFSTSYTESIDLAIAVRAALDRVTGTYNGVNVQSIAYMNETLSFEEAQRAYLVSSDYDVRIARSDFEIAQGSPITGVTLGELSDVEIAGVTDNQVLSYDSASNTWVPATDGGAISLNDLTDVIISAPESGEFFRYDGGEWVNDTAVKADVGLGNVDNTSDANKPVSTATQTALDLKADITSVPTDLDDLDDVQIIGTPTLGQALVYGAGKWLPGAAGATDLGDLDDVNTTGAAFGSLLTFNGSSWDISGGGLPTDDIYFHQRYETESEALRAGATATVELYFTCTAQGNGLAESASSDTPTTGYVINRKIYYSEAGFADPDTGTWVEFTPAPADDASFATAKAALLEYLKARTGGTVPISLKQTWEETAEAPAFTGLLNESYGSGAAAAYSTRRLNGNYTGACMTIRRASDSTTTTIGFSSEDIDESAITTFCTGTTCTVVTWHDQSQTGGTGIGNDATAPATANEPTIYTGGQLIKKGGRLAVEFDGTDTYLEDGAVITDQNAAFVAVATSYVVDSTSAAIGGLLASQTSWNSGFALTQVYTDLRFSVKASDLDVGISQDTQFVAFANYDGTTQGLSINGTNSTTASSQTFSISYDTKIGTRSSSTQRWDGTTQELIFYNSDKSTDRTDIEGNVSEYFQSAKLLDEQFGEGAEAAYSVRQLRRDQTDCMVIRRASDSTTTTIGFDSDGNIDEAAITTFCTGTTCTVYTWKDQSGNGNDATAASTGVEPTIYTGGAIVKDGGRVALASSNDKSFDFTQISDINSVFSVLRPTNFTSSSTSYILGDSTNYDYHAGNFGKWLDSVHADAVVKNGDNYLNGTSVDLTALTRSAGQYVLSMIHTANTAVASRISKDRHLDRSWVGNRQELIIYTDDRTSQLASIEENVGDYFTQNTPLLDTYTGAAACYSLRLMRTAYTGDCIEVYNGTAYLDIGFNVFGELDTVALADHCGSSDGTIRTWYDQSGNGEDMAQASTSNMPKIYDGSTGVVIRNGKPAVYFSTTNQLENNSWVSGNVNICDIINVHEMVSSSNGQILFWYDGSFQRMGIQTGNNVLDWSSGTVGEAVDTDQHLVYARANNGSGQIWTDSVAGSVGTTTTTRYFSDRFWINGNGFYGINSMVEMYQHEFVFYASNQSTSNRTGIESNINTFYSIY